MRKNRKKKDNLLPEIRENASLTGRFSSSDPFEEDVEHHFNESNDDRMETK